MAKNKIKSEARENITTALKAYAKERGAANKKEFFQIAIDSLCLSKEELAEKSSNGVYCIHRSLAGSIISELIGAGLIKVKNEDNNEKKQTEQLKETPTELRKLILDYLSEKYITDTEEKDKNKNAKINILKSIICDKNNGKEITERLLPDAVDFIEKKFIKAAKIDDKPISMEANGETVDFPNTIVGTALRNQYEKYQNYLRKQISYEDYYKSLTETIIDVLKKNNSAFFEKLSLDLIKATYGSNVIKDSDKITGGANDHGIDAVLKVVDNLGFEEKIVIQSKLSECGEKAIREFMGAMAFATAQKGIFITTANINSQVKEFVKSTSRTARRLLLIGRKDLLEKMEKTKIGIIKDNSSNLIIDNNYFLFE